MKIKIKRVYEKPDANDGFRVLMDRLWPRGLTKEKVKADLWLKEIAPSTELRKWFNHDPGKWNAFQKKYTKELENNKEAVSLLKGHLQKGPVTLLYSAKDESHNDAVVLQHFLS